MKNTVKQFLNEVFGEVRVLQKDSQIWFIASDIANILNYREPNDMCRSLDDDELSSVKFTDVNGRMQTYLIINESGLYSIVLSITKRNMDRYNKSRQFKKWITSTVIPALRKDGMYVDGEEKVVTGEMSDDELVLKVMTMLQEKVNRLQKERDEYKQTTEQFVSTTNLLEWDTVCKNLNIGRNTMLRKLRDMKILQTDQYEYRGRTCYGESHNVPYQQYMKYFDIKYIVKGDKRFPKVLVTAKGQEYLCKKLLGNEV